MRLIALAMAVALPWTLVGCGDNQSSPDGDCWYCSGNGGSTGKDGSTGKGTYTFTLSGSLDRSTGEGSYRITEADDGGTVCDVAYSVTGATEDTSCSACTFAYTMPLSMPNVAVAQGCSGSEGLDGTDVGYGHAEPDTLYSGKSGVWKSNGSGSTVDGDNWSFSVVIDLSGGK